MSERRPSLRRISSGLSDECVECIKLISIRISNREDKLDNKKEDFGSFKSENNSKKENVIQFQAKGDNGNSFNSKPKRKFEEMEIPAFVFRRRGGLSLTEIPPELQLTLKRFSERNSKRQRVSQ